MFIWKRLRNLVKQIYDPSLPTIVSNLFLLSDCTEYFVTKIFINAISSDVITDLAEIIVTVSGEICRLAPSTLDDNDGRTEKAKVRAAFADIPTQSRRLPTESPSLPITPTELQPGPWTSPVDDLPDEDLEDEAGGPQHPLLEKQQHYSRSPV